MTVSPIMTPPEGLLGDLAHYIYSQAPYPIPEVALAAAIGLLAGVTGSAYQTPIPMAGLNLYVLVVAPTGKGKEAGAEGIDQLVSAIIAGSGDNATPAMPAVAQFLGPSRFASEAAIERHLASKSRSFVSAIGEAGKWLQRLGNPKGSQHDKDVCTCLLKLYGKSKHGSIYRGSAYADTAKNVPDIFSPALSIYAEGTPETVFSTLTEDTIADGLFPRFLVLESSGDWPDLNQNSAHRPNAALVAKMSALCTRALELIQRNDCLQVQIEAEASTLLDRFRREIRRALEQAEDEVSRHLWSRSHLRAVKLASLVAVGIDHEAPKITRAVAEWAINLEQRATNGVSVRFDTGEAGDSTNNEAKQERELIRTVHRYITTEFYHLPKLRACPEMHRDHVVPLSYLQQSLTQKAAFKTDRTGATNALKRTIKNFLEAGDLQEMGRGQLIERYRKTGRAFAVSNPRRFIE